MTFLLNLPTELSHSILSEWLEIESWVRIDSAVSGIIQRQVLADLFKLLCAPEFCDGDEDRSSTYAWICAKCIKLKYWRIYSENIDKNGLVYSADLSHVESVVVDYGVMPSCSFALNRCKNLKQLEVNSQRVISMLDAVVCSSLTDISIYDRCSDDLAAIEQNCRQLKKFSLHPGNAGDEVRRIVACNPELEHIDVICDRKFYEFLCSGNFDGLRSICLDFYPFTLADVNRVIAGRRMECLKFGETLEYRARDGYLQLRDFDPEPDLLTFLSSLSHLKSIAYDGLYGQTDEMMRAVLEKSADTIEDFNIGVCQDLSVECLLEVFLRCHRMTRLVMYHYDLTNEMVLQLFNDKVPNKFDSFVLQLGSHMNVSTMSSVIRHCPYLQFCRFLRVPPVKLSENDKAELKLLKSWKSAHASHPLNMDIEWFSEDDADEVEWNPSDEEEYYLDIDDDQDDGDNDDDEEEEEDWDDDA